MAWGRGAATGEVDFSLCHPDPLSISESQPIETLGEQTCGVFALSRRAVRVACKAKDRKSDGRDRLRTVSMAPW